MKAVYGASGSKHSPSAKSMKFLSAQSSSLREVVHLIGVQVYGDFRIISFENDQVFAYIRTLGNATALVLLNFKETEVVFPLDEVKDFNGFKLVLGNYPSEKELPSGSAVLKGYEGKVYIN